MQRLVPLPVQAVLICKEGCGVWFRQVQGQDWMVSTIFFESLSFGCGMRVHKFETLSSNVEACCIWLIWLSKDTSLRRLGREGFFVKALLFTAVQCFAGVAWRLSSSHIPKILGRTVEQLDGGALWHSLTLYDYMWHCFGGQHQKDSKSQAQHILTLLVLLVSLVLLVLVRLQQSGYTARGLGWYAGVPGVPCQKTEETWRNIWRNIAIIYIYIYV